MKILEANILKMSNPEDIGSKQFNMGGDWSFLTSVVSSFLKEIEMIEVEVKCPFIWQLLQEK